MSGEPVSLLFDSLKEEFPLLAWDEFRGILQEILDEIGGKEKISFSEIYILLKRKCRIKIAELNSKKLSTQKFIITISLLADILLQLEGRRTPLLRRR
jgi:hypothetical protein